MKKLYAALTAILVLVALEAIWTLFLRSFGERFRFPEPERYFASPAAVETARAGFDPELGWRVRYATRFGERPRAKEYGRPLVAAFGDSFVHGDESADADTWAEALAGRLGGDVYNFGASAYGMDQALMRMERDLEKVRAPVALLGFISPDVERNVTVYWKFLYPRDDVALVKPRFTLGGDELVLEPNPVASADELARLTWDAELIRRMGAADFFYDRWHLPEPSFPRLRLLFDPDVLALALHGPDRGDLWDVDEPRALAEAILVRFARASRERGARPVCVHLPVAWEMTTYADEGVLPPAVGRFREICARRELTCFAPLAETPPLPRETIARLFTRGLEGGHYSAEGNRLLADVLARALAPELAAACCVSGNGPLRPAAQSTSKEKP